MKRLLLILALIPALSFGLWADGGTKKPLDLPAGGVGTEQDDEDAPETIQFYGSEYEGEAFFWCFHAFNF